MNLALNLPVFKALFSWTQALPFKTMTNVTMIWIQLLLQSNTEIFCLAAIILQDALNLYYLD